MLIVDTFAHITLRGRITWLFLFFLCWWCCPSVLCVSFFFAVVAFFSENSVIKDFSWTMAIFFFLSRFSIVLSLLPITFYVTLELYHDHQRRLVQKANNAYSSVNPHYGRGIPSVSTITHAPGTLNDACTTAYNSFSSVTSGFAMLIDRSVCIRDAPLFRRYQQVSDDHQQRWISNSGLGEPYSSIDFFRGLAAYIDYVDYLKYWNRSFGIDSLVSKMATLSLTASSLEQAPLVHAPPTDDGSLDCSGDISSFVACRCGGTGYTTHGSCSCLGHVCSGVGCACFISGNGSRYGTLRMDDNRQLGSEKLSGLIRGAWISGGWFLEAMNSLQDQLARLTLGGGNGRFAISGLSNDGMEYLHDASCFNGESQPSVVFGVNSLLQSDVYVSEVLSSMMNRCLSIMDDQTSNGGDGDSGPADVETSYGYKSRLNTLDANSTGHLPIYKSADKTTLRESTIEVHGFVDQDLRSIGSSGSSIGPSSSRHDDELNGSDVEISRPNKGFLSDVDTDSACSNYSDNSDISVSLHHNYKRDNSDQFVDDTNNQCYDSQGSVNDGSTSPSGEEVQRDLYNSSEHGDDVWSNASSYSGEWISEQYQQSQWESTNSREASVASPASPARSLGAYDYEESYNPFHSDDDNSSTGTIPLYTGTAVFNDESAFGTFDL